MMIMILSYNPLHNENDDKLINAIIMTVLMMITSTIFMLAMNWPTNDRADDDHDTNGMDMKVMIRPTNNKIECLLKQLKKDLRHKSKEGSSYQNLPGKKSGFYKMKTSQ